MVQHPGVKQSVVFAAHDVLLGQGVDAAFVLRDEVSTQTDDVQISQRACRGIEEVGANVGPDVSPVPPP